MACNCNKIIEIQVENERLMKTMEGVISKFQKENENLKKLNEQLLGKPVGVTEWEQLVAENEKLKIENERLTQRIENQRKEIIIFNRKYRLEHALRVQAQETWREENDNLIRDKETISHNANHFGNEIIKLEQEAEKLKAENEQLKKSVDSYIAQHVKSVAENTQLKAENQQLSGISGQLKADNESIKEQVKRRVRTIIALGRRSKALEEENAQLKAQLQNRDKVSRVEQKCSCCNGKGFHERTAHELSEIHNYNASKYYGCTSCDNKGIVWEPK